MKSPDIKKLVSIFSGAGGLDLAFELEGGFSSLALFDAEPVFCSTLNQNRLHGHFNGAEVICGDIKVNDPATLIREGGGLGLTGLIGGPPCEAFSSMGRRQSTLDPRGQLVFEFVRWARNPKFSFFVFENVPDLIKVDDGQTFELLLEGFEKAGYSVSAGILCAADYGAATTRKRVIIIGSRVSKASLPPPSHSSELNLLEAPRSPWVPSYSVLHDLIDEQTHSQLQHHRLVEHTEAVSLRFASTKPGGYDNIRKRSRLHPDRPSPSLVAGNFGGTRNHIHPTLPRELTNREIARIQGFPDGYFFTGTQAQVAKQITNAVPIELGRAIARHLNSILSGVNPIIDESQGTLQ
jgi:DNA (cytosine-5)-methyltransferase 1